MGYLGGQERHAVLLGGSLQARSHVHVRGKVRGVHLLQRAHGTLYAPARVQAKTHAHLVK
jgi:hypothetical protein